MNRILTLRFFAQVFAIAFGFTQVAQAVSLILTLTPDTLNGVPDGSYTFSGSITNSDVIDVFLNGALSSVSSPDLTVDDQLFFLNTPLFLSPNETFLGDIFTVNVGLNTPAGLHHGTFEIQGGVDANSFDTLASAGFAVNVAMTPEPSTIILIILGIGSAILIRTRHWNSMHED